MILKPSNILPDNAVYPKDEDIQISWKNNGDVMNSFEVIIEDNTNNTVIYQSGRIYTFITKHTVPANTLQNGKVYRYKIIVYNSQGQNVASDYKIIRCNSRPVITIPSDGYIRNQVATANATYSQAENIPIKAYRFVLFDEFHNVLEQSDYIYDNALTYTFQHTLADGAKYYVRCYAISQNDILGSSEIDFIADYISPQVYFSLSAETTFDKPYVRLTWTTVRIIAETEGDTSFVGNEKLDVRQGKVYYDRGFSLNGNYTLRLWVEQPKTSADLFRLHGSNGDLIVQYYNNRIHVFKVINGFKTHYGSQALPSIVGKQVYIGIQQIDKNINVFSEVI